MYIVMYSSRPSIFLILKFISIKGLNLSYKKTMKLLEKKIEGIGEASLW